jgi:hypothetical protein
MLFYVTIRHHDNVEGQQPTSSWCKMIDCLAGGKPFGGIQ